MDNNEQIKITKETPHLFPKAEPAVPFANANQPKTPLADPLSESEKKPKKWIIFAFCLGIATITLIAYTVFYIDSTLEKKYIDEKSKYELTYPAQWKLYKEKDTAVLFKKPFEPDSPVTEHLKKNMCALFLPVSTDYKDMTLEEFARGANRLSSSGGVVKKKLGGYDFAEIEVGDFDCPSCQKMGNLSRMKQDLVLFVAANSYNHFFPFIGLNAKKENCGKEVESLLSTVKFHY